mmetsp:Transcript_11039/g.15710  ORF Transcript_11039/g.15710 Transcript_11039/m.15710 type:complete len:83 (+) Transcript_11039:726-974(+)
MRAFPKLRIKTDREIIMNIKITGITYLRNSLCKRMLNRFQRLGWQLRGFLKHLIVLVQKLKFFLPALFVIIRIKHYVSNLLL